MHQRYFWNLPVEGLPNPPTGPPHLILQLQASTVPSIQWGLFVSSFLSSRPKEFQFVVAIRANRLYTIECLGMSDQNATTPRVFTARHGRIEPRGRDFVASTHCSYKVRPNGPFLANVRATRISRSQRTVWSKAGPPATCSLGREN